ncbi:MAG: hypothetical protein WC846_05455 [Candidatus Gracilibacteria bacterium]|jgi:hypothetical protein
MGDTATEAATQVKDAASSAADSLAEAPQMFEVFGKKLLDGSNLYNVLADWGNEHPNEFKEKLSQWRTDVDTFLMADGKINRDALKAKLNVKETMALLMDSLFTTQILHFIGNTSLSRADFDALSYEDSVQFFEEQGSSVKDVDGNMVWEGMGPFGGMTALWDVIRAYREGKDKQKIPFPMPLRLVVPAEKPKSSNPSFTPTRISLYQTYCDKMGIKLKVLTPKESLAKPDKGAKEVQYVSTIGDLPLTANGKSIDMETLKWYVQIWEEAGDEDGTHAMWTGADALTAAIKCYLAGDNMEAVLKESLGANPFLPQYEALLRTITPRGKEALAVKPSETPAVVAAAPAAPAPTAPAEPAAEPAQTPAAQPAEPPKTPEKTVAP